jgi:hypothetical protein
MMNLKNKLITFLLLMFAAALCFSGNEICLYAAEHSLEQATEYEIKAVYLYNFLFFTQWPENKNDSGSDNEEFITIGIIGKDPFTDSFEKVEGKIIKAKKKRLRIRRFGTYRNNLDITKCDLLFICQSEKNNVERILQKTKAAPILTVSELPRALESGVMINLLEIKRKIRWEINQTPVKKAGLRLSSQLLRNAVRVVEIPKEKTQKEGS